MSFYFLGGTFVAFGESFCMKQRAENQVKGWRRPKEWDFTLISSPLITEEVITWLKNIFNIAHNVYFFQKKKKTMDILGESTFVNKLLFPGGGSSYCPNQKMFGKGIYNKILILELFLADNESSN